MYFSEIAVYFPKFTGNSYLEHYMPDISETGTIDLYVTFKTDFESGTILYSSSPDQNFLHLFIENSMLKYQLSCGGGSVFVVDTQHVVDHGNLTEATIRYYHHRC